jgi:hypothetical protein
MAHDGGTMNAILYPVAASAEAALASPRGRAAREREAVMLAGEAVRFVTEPTGPGFATREAALDAYAGRLDDTRAGRRHEPLPEDRWCALAERLEGAASPPKPVEPTFRKGHRWPDPLARRPATVFRLMVSYWKLGAAPLAEAPGVEEAEPGDAPGQARALRRRAGASGLTAAELRAIAQQPLRPVRPQQPLDVGLFEMPAPEAPHILIPDE